MPPTGPTGPSDHDPSEDDNQSERPEFEPASTEEKDAILGAAQKRFNTAYNIRPDSVLPPVLSDICNDSQGRQVRLVRYLQLRPDGLAFKCKIREFAKSGLIETSYLYYYDPENDNPMYKHEKMITKDDLEQDLDLLESADLTAADGADQLEELGRQIDDREDVQRMEDFELVDPRISHDEAKELERYLQALPPAQPPRPRP